MGQMSGFQADSGQGFIRFIRFLIPGFFTRAFQTFSQKAHLYYWTNERRADKNFA